jgi:hypothetical protein
MTHIQDDLVHSRIQTCTTPLISTTVMIYDKVLPLRATILACGINVDVP